jgi:thioredoxin reductase
MIVDRYGNREEVLADSIVVAIGFTPRTVLAEELEKETGLEVYTVGDCVNPRKIFEAIHEGYLAAYSLI